jgi:hypothetical protein
MQKSYELRLRSEVDGPFDEAVEAAKLEYFGEIARGQKSAQLDGKIEEVIAFQEEEKMLAAGRIARSKPEDTTPESLKRLRATYLETINKLEADRDRRVEPILNPYLRKLDDLAVRLTKEGNIEGAKAVLQAKREAQPAYLRASGAWVFNHRGKAYRRILNRDGTLTDKEGGPRLGHWKMQETKVRIDWNNGDVDELFFPLNPKGTQGRAADGRDMNCEKLER